MARGSASSSAIHVICSSRDCSPNSSFFASILLYERGLMRVCREQEAAAAQKEFRSKLGDHVTLLQLMRAFEAGPQKKRAAWCLRHFVSYKALRHAERVQAQLQACHQYYDLDTAALSNKLKVVWTMSRCDCCRRSM
jgi:hypothetical protein